MDICRNLRSQLQVLVFRHRSEAIAQIWPATVQALRTDLLNDKFRDRFISIHDDEPFAWQS